MIMLGIVLAIHAAGAILLLWGPSPVMSRLARKAIVAGACLSAPLLILGFLLRFARVNRYFPDWWAGWGRGVIISWAFVSVLLLAAVLVSRWWLTVRPQHTPARRL